MQASPAYDKADSSSGAAPMEIDPIDDGPLPPTNPPTPAGYSSRLANNHSPAALLLSNTPMMTQQDEAQQTIELLRAAPDMAQRVAAAHRLPAVAHVLGPERTRTVRVAIYAVKQLIS
jgi:hypothetical protein